jgi:hypothetical protein
MILNKDCIIIFMSSFEQGLSFSEAECLTPLSEITDRREAFSRFLGPITNAFAILAIDEAAARHKEEPLALREYCGQDHMDAFVEPWFHEKRPFGSIYEATIGLALISTKIIGSPTAAIHLSVPELTSLTIEQQTLVNNFDREMVENDFESVANSTMEGQGGVTFRAALPAYLAQEYEAMDPVALLKVFNRIKLEEVEEILTRQEFLNALMSMAFAPNGTYAGLDTDFQTSEEDIRFQEAGYEVGAGLVEVITPELRAVAEVAGLAEQLEGIKDTFSVYDLFERKDDGSIGLAGVFVKSMRIAIRLESLFQTNYEGMTPTDGCPAAKKRSRIQIEDFTKGQQGKLLSGLKPIASYDSNTGLLTMLRSPIKELHNIHMAALREAIISEIATIPS